MTAQCRLHSRSLDNPAATLHCSILASACKLGPTGMVACQPAFSISSNQRIRDDTPLLGTSMAYVTAHDDTKLFYEQVGSGTPIIFVHEFAGDHRSWELQMRHFGRRYRCIAYNARGYPPSDVPDDVESYSQDRARDDIRAMLDALSIDRAHIVGLSMGGFAALHFGFTYPKRARSLVVGGCGYGASP